MTTDFIQSVEDFNRIGQVRPPCHGFDENRVGFYTGMQLEELAEKMQALADAAPDQTEKTVLAHAAFYFDQLGKKFKDGFYQSAIHYADREALLDADIDIAVVTFGSASYQTPNYRQAANHVAGRNLAKFPDGKAMRDPVSNKIMKPIGWTPPDLAPYILPRED